MDNQYISDSIDGAYEHWNEGDCIFLSAPTGSGKTTFILNTLLPYYASQSKKILYLVNRKILKAQLDKQLRDYQPQLRLCISVELYQTIEMAISELNYESRYSEYYYGYVQAIKDCEKEIDQTKLMTDTKFVEAGYFVKGYNHPTLHEFSKYDCVVCDECHYYFTDSNYNTNTYLSYQFVQRVFRDKIRIFMSATISETQTKVVADGRMLHYAKTGIYDFNVPNFIDPTINSDRYNYCYGASKNYDHVNIEVIESRNQIAGLISKSEQKWLVFVDSIEYGKTLKRELKKYSKDDGNTISVEFITADYAMDVDAVDEVSSIVANSKQNAKVLIATSVLDNGINLKDSELRDIIIIADSETEFLQMLGRRRNDGLPVTVYIFKHDQNHFKKRLATCQRRYEIAFNYYAKLEKIVAAMNSYEEDAERQLERINKKEYEIVKAEHKKLMQGMMNNQIRFEDIKSMFYVIDGVLRLNFLSMYHLHNLIQYYREVVMLFDKDEDDAYYKVQLNWLEKNEDVLERAKKDSFERAKMNVIEGFNLAVRENGEKHKENKADLPDNVFYKKDWISAKNKLRDDIIEVLSKGKDVNSEKYASYCKDIKKTDRPLSGDQMDFLRDVCGLPFYLDVEDGKKGISAKYTLVFAKGNDGKDNKKTPHN